MNSNESHLVIEQSQPQMSSPFSTIPAPERPFVLQNATSITALKGTGNKRGRKPKNTTLATESIRNSSQSNPTSPTSSQPTPLHWTAIQSTATVLAERESLLSTTVDQTQPMQPISETVDTTGLPGSSTALHGEPLSFHGTNITPGAPVADEDGEGEEELLPAMEEDDYSAQLSWQSQSKDNLKYAHVFFFFFAVES